MKRIIFMILVLSFFAGCIPTIIGSAVYKSVKDNKARQEFVAQYQQANIEREKAKLPPLDYCTEARRFNEKWANKQPECK